MPPVNKKQLSSRLSKRLANFKLSDAVIKSLADRVLDRRPVDRAIRSLHLRHLHRLLHRQDPASSSGCPSSAASRSGKSSPTASSTGTDSTCGSRSTSTSSRARGSMRDSAAECRTAGNASMRSGFLPDRIIHLHPTRLCNLACLHCYSESDPQHGRRSIRTCCARRSACCAPRATR